MPRGMDERFEDPSDEEETTETDAQNVSESMPDSEDINREAVEDTPSSRSSGQTETESSNTAASENGDEPLNIRKDWDSATIYVEPEQSEDIEITFTRLKKQLKREGITLEKNKHFYRGIFEVAFGMHQEETKEKVRELAKQDTET